MAANPPVNDMQIRFLGPPQPIVPFQGPPDAQRNARPGAQRRDRGVPPRPRPPNREQILEALPAPAAHPPHQGLINLGERERITIHHALTADDHEYFAETYPNLNIEIVANSMPHSHPRLAFDRKYAERCVYNMISRPNLFIIDIGGNPIRHAANHRVNVHSCCPILDPTDAVRNNTHRNPPAHLPMPPIFCEHLAQDCRCVQPHSYLSVHSLYYLTPPIILACLLHCTSHTLHAVLHEFPEIYGAFAGGEAQYHVSADQTVSMLVRGSSQPYVHSVLPWFSSGYFSDGVNAMAWSSIRDFAWSKYYKFVLSPINLRNAITPFRELRGSILDTRYYGAVRFGGLAFGSNVDAVHTRITSLAVDFDSFFSWGTWILGKGTTRTKQFLLPKSFVSELAARVAGLARNSVEFNRLLGFARIHIRSYDLPAQVVTDSILLSTCLAFTLNIEAESALLGQMLQRAPVNVREEHQRLLAFDPVHRLDFTRFIHLIVLLVPLLFLLPYLEPLYLSFIALVAAAMFAALRTRVDRPDAHLYVMDIFSVLWRWWRLSIFYRWWYLSLYRYVDYGFNSYRTTFCSFEFPVPFALPLSKFVDFPSLVSNRPLAPIRGRVSPGIAYEPDVPNGFVGVGLINPSCMPIVHQRGPRNDLLAVVNRFAVRRDEPDLVVFNQFFDFVRTNFDILFPNYLEYRNYLTIETFSDEWFEAYRVWNERFPRNIQHLHMLSLERHIIGLADPVIYMRLESFMKVEKLLHGSQFNPKNGDPRAIQARNQDLNVVTGPWIFRMAGVLRKIWSLDHFITYTPGLSTLELGSWLPDHNPPGFSFYERDTERFDASIHALHIMLILYIYTRFFADAIVLQHKRRDLNKVGATKYGTTFSTPWRVASGTDDTNLFDSIINGLCEVYLNYMRSVHLNFRSFLQRSGFATAVCGDDGVTRIRGFLFYEPRDYRLLGFVVEILLCTDTRDLTFCSGRFWPTSRGMCFAVNPGRVFAKNAYYIDIPYKHLFATHRAVLFAILHDFSFLPPIVAFARAQLSALPAHITGRPLTTGQFRNTVGYFSRFNLTRGDPPLCTSDTWDMLAHVYSWTQTDQIRLEDQCRTVTSLPSVFQPSGINKFISRDDCTVDPRWFTMDFYSVCASFYPWFCSYPLITAIFISASYTMMWFHWPFTCIALLPGRILSPLIKMTADCAILDCIPYWFYSWFFNICISFLWIFMVYDASCNQPFIVFSPGYFMFIALVTSFCYMYILALDDILARFVHVRFYCQHLHYEGTIDDWFNEYDYSYDQASRAFPFVIPVFGTLYRMFVDVPHADYLVYFVDLPTALWQHIYPACTPDGVIRLAFTVMLEEVFKRWYPPYGFLLLVSFESILKFATHQQWVPILVCLILHSALTFLPVGPAMILHFIWNYALLEISRR